MENEIKAPREFVTTDTHGCYKQLLACLEQAGFDFEIDKLIHLGDVCDRGPNTFEVVELLLRIKNLVAIKGNHDDWFNVWLRTGKHPGWWLHGGVATIGSYGEAAKRKVNMFPRNGAFDTDFNSTDVPNTHKQFFRNQLIHHTDDKNRFFCHAGYDPTKLIDDHDDFEFFWDRELIYKLVDEYREKGTVANYEDINKFSRVFIGHTPTISFTKERKGGIIDYTLMKPQDFYPATPMYLGQLVDLDTGGCFDDGKVTLIDITDDANHITYQA